MGLLDDIESQTNIEERGIMPIIFIIDTSCYMAGRKIEVLNDTLENFIALLKQSAKQNADFEFRIAVVTFSNTAEWQYNRFVPIEEYEWIDVSAGGSKNIGQAYTKVHQVLRTIKQLGSVIQTKPPLLMLVSNKNEPDDYYQPSLNDLKKYNWFKCALKFAVVIKNDFLEDFTNSQEAIITDVNKLLHIIKCLNYVVCVDPEAPCSDESFEPEVKKESDLIKEGLDNIGVNSLDTSNFDLDEW